MKNGKHELIYQKTSGISMKFLTKQSLKLRILFKASYENH